MSYLRKIEYTIIPEASYKVIRNCAGCGCRSAYRNTHSFRVNANGNKIDVWLIYQCEKCKHTLNLSIFERQRPEVIPQENYQKFLENDKMLAGIYGTDKSFFMKSKATIDYADIPYKIIEKDPTPAGGCSADGNSDKILFQSGDRLIISNPYELKIRSDKIISQLLGITRSQEKKLEQNGAIEVMTGTQTLEVLIHDGCLFTPRSSTPPPY